MLLIALATFDPRDPAPFFKAGADGPARNFIGPFGAFLAELLIPQLFGLAALLLPLVLGLAGLEALLVPADRRPLHEGRRQPRAAALPRRVPGARLRHRRLRGRARARRAAPWASSWPALLVADFSRTGAYIVVATALFVALILSTQFSFSRVPRAALGARVGERLRAMRTAWAHYRESRRKEKMRRDVIRKHTQAREDDAAGCRASAG